MQHNNGRTTVDRRQTTEKIHLLSTVYCRLFLAAATLFFLTACSTADASPRARPIAATSKAVLGERIAVRTGDTVYGVARRYGVSMTELIAVNNLHPPYRLEAGMSLNLPAQRMIEAAPPGGNKDIGTTVIAGKSQPKSAKTLFVESGDSGDVVYSQKAPEEPRIENKADAPPPTPRTKFAFKKLEKPPLKSPQQLAQEEGDDQIIYVPAKPGVKLSAPLEDDMLRAKPKPTFENQAETIPPKEGPPAGQEAESAPPPKPKEADKKPAPKAPEKKPVAKAVEKKPAAKESETPEAGVDTPVLPSPEEISKESQKEIQKEVEKEAQDKTDKEEARAALAEQLKRKPLKYDKKKHQLKPPASKEARHSDVSSVVAAAAAAAKPTPAGEDDAARKTRFIWPVQGPVLSGFGPKSNGLRNDGMNIGAPRGTPVVAADAGTVAYAGSEIPGYGNVVLVRHASGLMTTYAHLDRMFVQRDDVVARGDVLGAVGTSGGLDTPQLHFEIRHEKQALDPGKYLYGK